MSETTLAFTLILSGFAIGGLVTYWRGIAAAIPVLLLEPFVCGFLMVCGFSASGYLTCSPSFQASEWLLSNRLAAMGLPIEGNVGQFTLAMLLGIAVATWPRLRLKYDQVMGVEPRQSGKKVMNQRIRSATTTRVERGGWFD